MNFSFFAIVAAASFLVSFTFAHADYNSHVKTLTASNFNDFVIKSEKAVMVKFYAPYCGYCKKMIPAYNKLAENLKDLVEIAAIDCTNSFNAPICSKYKIEGYPTLKFFVIQENANEQGKRKKIVLDYNGDRNTAEMTKFIKYRMHQFIFKVSEKALKSTAASKWNVNFENFFSKGGNMPKLLLFRTSTRESPTVLFRALSIKYHYKIVVGEVSTSEDSSYAAKFNLPTGKVGLIYFPEGSESNFVAYNGKITREDIFAFLDKQLVTKPAEKAEL